MILVFLLTLSSALFAEDFVPNSFTVNYSKKYISSLTKKEVIQKGTLKYLYPGYARLESHVTTETIFVLNHDTSWFYQGSLTETKEPSQVRISKSTPLPIMKALDSMKKGFEQSVYFTKKNNGFDVILTSKPDFMEESNIKEIHLEPFRHSLKSMAEVKKLTTVEVDGLKTIYEFDKFEDAKFTKEDFVFKIPKNTKVIDEAQKQTASPCSYKELFQNLIREDKTLKAKSIHTFSKTDRGDFWFWQEKKMLINPSLPTSSAACKTPSLFINRFLTTQDGILPPGKEPQGSSYLVTHDWAIRAIYHAMMFGETVRVTK